MKLGLAASVSACVMLGACASVTRGTTDAWEVSSDPIGAKVETTHGHQCPATPCSIRMSRKSEFVATVTKPGYKPATVTVTHKTAKAGAAGMAGNVLIGGLIGIAIDSTTGATQDLTPNPAFLKLEPASIYDAPSVAAPWAAAPPAPEPPPEPEPPLPPPPVSRPLPPPPPLSPSDAEPLRLAGGPPPAAPELPRVHAGNVIKGSAFLRAGNGQQRTCAGRPVRLFPVNETTQAFVAWTFGSPAGGFSRRTGWEPQPFDHDVQFATCDAQGVFVFDRAPDGDYYVAAVVSIETPAGGSVSYLVQEGGTLATRVSVSGGAVQSVTLTR
ncbi:hypothetical protein [Caulobacter sp. RHG1]|uniref:hypothetical protein n=1 Tax=Caulobacter sp. (strain RHG1) TaxID=2545762 RepID=UPI0019D6A09F|nr:hypothetical protein [Caulobacter sp. RHG1]NQE65140.1 hypothetical protein [Caulobacter sp. RHG1]